MSKLQPFSKAYFIAHRCSEGQRNLDLLLFLRAMFPILHTTKEKHASNENGAAKRERSI
jgi:hypothetical protein